MTNLHQAMRHLYLRIFLEERLMAKMLSGEIKVTDHRWRAYCTLIELADEMYYRWSEMYNDNN
jgi:hypothetical protein